MLHHLLPKLKTIDISVFLQLDLVFNFLVTMMYWYPTDGYREPWVKHQVKISGSIRVPIPKKSGCRVGIGLRVESGGVELGSRLSRRRVGVVLGSTPCRVGRGRVGVEVESESCWGRRRVEAGGVKLGSGSSRGRVGVVLGSTRRRVEARSSWGVRSGLP